MTQTLERVLAVVAERRAEFEEKRHVPRDVIAEFKNGGIYRAGTPKKFGGDASPPADFLRVIERISTVDGSAYWVASFGSSAIYLAALPLETQAELYADGPDVAFAGGLFPVQPAERVEGGYRVSGRWKFASGCKGADVLGVGIKAGQDKAYCPLTAVLRPEQVEIAENWDVIGMRGTGSHDLVVDGAVVPEEWTFVRGGTPTVDEPLYRYPTVPYAAQVLAVVGLGVARAALDQAIADGGRAGLHRRAQARRTRHLPHRGGPGRGPTPFRPCLLLRDHRRDLGDGGGRRPRDQRAGRPAAARLRPPREDRIRGRKDRVPTQWHPRHRRRQPHAALPARRLRRPAARLPPRGHVRRRRLPC